MLISSHIAAYLIYVRPSGVYQILCYKHMPAMFVMDNMILARTSEYGYDYCQRCCLEDDHRRKAAIARTAPRG